MFLIIHILIAVSSLIFSGLVMLSPSKRKLNISYGLIAATFASGTYLIFTNSAHMLMACIEGLAYLAIVSIATVFASKKLAKERSRE